MRQRWMILGMVGAMLAFGAGCSKEESTPKDSTTPASERNQTDESSSPAKSDDPSSESHINDAALAPSTPKQVEVKPRVKITTSEGEIILELEPEAAPISVENFLSYVDSGFYEGLIFHRVISTFMIQGGGYTPDFEKKSDGLLAPIRNEADNGLTNDRGTIAMARSGPHTATAQFFINVVNNTGLNHDQPQRDGWGYCVFGKVIEGMDVVDKIRDTPVQASRMTPPGQRPAISEPIDPPVIVKVERVQAAADSE